MAIFRKVKKTDFTVRWGQMAEWLKAPVLKTGVRFCRIQSSNLCLSAMENSLFRPVFLHLKLDNYKSSFVVR